MTEFSTAARAGQLRRTLENNLLSQTDRARFRAELDDLEELLRNAR